MCRSRSVLLALLAILLPSLFVCMAMSAQADTDGPLSQGSAAVAAVEPDSGAAAPQVPAESISAAPLPQAQVPSEPRRVRRSCS